MTTTSAEGLLHELDPRLGFERDAGGCWVRDGLIDVRAMAGLMVRNGIRLMTITARPWPEGGFRLIYHWDTGPEVLNVCTTVTGGLPTIADLVPGADWAEREIHDYYDLEFRGRGATPTLMLLESDPPGLFTRTADTGRDTDPARTARSAADAAGADAPEADAPEAVPQVTVPHVTVPHVTVPQEGEPK
jgi:hypothetical protein